MASLLSYIHAVIPRRKERISRTLMDDTYSPGHKKVLHFDWYYLHNYMFAIGLHHTTVKHAFISLQIVKVDPAPQENLMQKSRRKRSHVRIQSLHALLLCRRCGLQLSLISNEGQNRTDTSPTSSYTAQFTHFLHNSETKSARTAPSGRLEHTFV